MNSCDILLVGLNAKFSHTALGVRSIGAYLTKQGVSHQVAEYSVNDPYESIFYDTSQCSRFHLQSGIFRKSDNNKCLT